MSRYAFAPISLNDERTVARLERVPFDAESWGCDESVEIIIDIEHDAANGVTTAKIRGEDDMTDEECRRAFQVYFDMLAGRC